MPATKPPRDALPRADAERALAIWREHDGAQALHGPDRDAVRATETLRSLVLELLARPGRGRDLYNACAQLGRLLADAGASPSLTVSSLDGAVRALGELGVVCDEARLSPARASVAEGYFAAVVAAEAAKARGAWEYPACAVKVAPTTVAIAAGYPTDDGEALADWSARVALCVSRDGYKQAILRGAESAKNELGQALTLVGVELAEPAESKGWLATFLRR
jgi:hypothetical protein